LKYTWSKLNWNTLGWFVALEVGLIVIIASFFLPGGDDLYRFYLPFASGCLDCGFVPYFAQWILWPLSLLPPRFVWPIWTTVSVAGFIVLCWYTKINPGIVILSFPAMGQFWLGQIDVIVGAGLVIGLLATNPYLRGIGILLALVKPQLAGLVVLILLIQQPRHELIKVLVLPFVAMIVSFLIYGFTWPINWLTNSLDNLPLHVWRLASNDIWPYGMIFVVTLFMLSSRRPRFEATLMISALATPFYGVYSYLIFLIFRAPWWSLPLSYAWVLLYPVWGKASMRFAWILPVGLLGYLLFKEGQLGRRWGVQVTEKGLG
jgi:hypothetical protein